MIRQGLALALGAGLLIGFAGHADAKRAKAAMPNTVIVKGCARPAPPFCTVIGAGPLTYSLHSAAPPVPVNVGVTVVGVKDGDVSPCFATPLRVLKWSRNRLRCPTY
jgi:hypothetical protein